MKITYGAYLLEQLANVKHRENRKTLPWEHQLRCQMCQIALSKKIEKVNLKNLVIYSSDSSEGSEINHATYLKKKSHPLIFFSFFSEHFLIKQFDTKVDQQKDG